MASNNHNHPTTESKPTFPDKMPESLHEYARQKYEASLVTCDNLRQHKMIKKYLHNFFFHPGMNKVWEQLTKNQISPPKLKSLITLASDALINSFVFSPSSIKYAKSYIEKVEATASNLLHLTSIDETRDTPQQIALKAILLDELLMVQDIADSEELRHVAYLAVRCQLFLKNENYNLLKPFTGSRKSQGDEALKIYFIKRIGDLFIHGYKKPMYSTIATMVDQVFAVKAPTARNAPTLTENPTSIEAVRKLISIRKKKNGSFTAR